MAHFQILAHRGASAQHPDNSEAAFQAAIDQGADLIETDVHCTVDGVLILIHDGEIGGQPIAGATLAELQKLDSGLMTVSAALMKFGSRIPFCWEIKTPGVEVALINLVRDFLPKRFWERTQFTSFHFESAEICRTLAPKNTVGWLTENWDEAAIHRAQEAGLSQICPDSNQVLESPELVQQAQNAGLQVRAWKVTSIDLVPKLADLGVNGCTSNWVAEAVAALSHSGIAQDVVLYQDDLIRIIVPHDAHISPEDGGHLIILPLKEYTGIENCPRDLRYRLIDAVAVASSALLSLPNMEGGIINVQDNGNWFYRDEAGRAPKSLHIHIYGRAPTATEQLFGEALRFPPYAKRHTVLHPIFDVKEQELLRTKIVAEMEYQVS